MKRLVALLVTVFCLAFSMYPPGTQGGASSESQETSENPTTRAARKQALADRQKSASEARQSNDLLKLARALNEAGHLQLQLNLPEDALATFKENLTVADQLGDPVVRVDALNGVAAAYLYSGKYDEATPLLQQALTLSEQNNYVSGRAEALLLQSKCDNRTDHSKALTTAQEALALWQTTGINRGIIRSHLTVATYQFAQNSLDDATQSNESALSLAQKAGLKDFEAEALINLGYIEYRRGAWHNVTKFMSDARKLIEAEADPYKMTQITAAIAEAYIESGMPETGHTKYLEAVEYFRNTPKPTEQTILAWGVGRALLFSGNYDKAREKFEDALADAKLLNEPVVVAMCQEFLGRTYEAKGDHAKALENLADALRLYSDADNPMEVARTRALIGQVHENAGKLEEARNSYQEALQRFEAHSDRVNQSATLFALGRLEMKRLNYEIAEPLLRQSIEVTENMRRMSTSRDLTAAFSATVHDRYEQYIQCLMRNHREPASASRVALAFETSESARARSLAELLRTSDTNLLTNVDPELSKKERSLRQLLRMKEDERVALLRKKYEKSQLDKLDAEQERLNAEYKSVLATINERYPAFEKLTRPRSWNLRRIQEEVIGDDNTLLLEFLLGPEKSYVWAVTQSGITSHELQSQTVITDAVKKVYDLLMKQPTPATKDDLDQATRELAQIILSPVADQLQKQRILVAADGVLNYIPFQILPVGANAEPLVAQHEVINVPSASILGELRKEAEARRGTRGKVLAALGDPLFPKQNQNMQVAQTRSIVITDDIDQANLGSLFYAAREIENLREVATEAQTFTATKSDATRDRLLSLDLSQFAILHFATHGLLRPSNPESSGLVLSTINSEGQTVDGFVGLQDIYSLRAPVDLVVLSACQTGLGKDIRGEGLIGLTRGFMYAGATSVVASLWKVEDEATAELMKRFYTEMLKNGKTPSEALRLAQNSIRQDPQNPQWGAPHFWAGFTLQGEYRYVVNVPRGWQTYQLVLLSAVAAVILGVLSAFFWRRSSRH